ncbi:unnamed protein product [Closterium sp. Naga37s-1]|nr:unnamed protein product [Closterium sp. Naga37s-1]
MPDPAQPSAQAARPVPHAARLVRSHGLSALSHGVVADRAAGGGEVKGEAVGEREWRAAIADCMQWVEGDGEGLYGSAGSSSSSSSNSRGSSGSSNSSGSSGVGGSGSRDEGTDESLIESVRKLPTSFPALLPRYVALRTAIQPWSDLFFRRHSRRPTMTDVHSTHMPWLVEHFHLFRIAMLRLRPHVSPLWFPPAALPAAAASAAPSPSFLPPPPSLVSSNVASFDDVDEWLFSVGEEGSGKESGREEDRQSSAVSSSVHLQVQTARVDDSAEMKQDQGRGGAERGEEEGEEEEMGQEEGESSTAAEQGSNIDAHREDVGGLGLKQETAVEGGFAGSSRVMREVQEGQGGALQQGGEDIGDRGGEWKI